MSGTYEIEIVRDLASLQHLKDEWDGVAPCRHREPWQTFNWVEACATTFSKNHLLRIIVVRQNGRIAAIAPLVSRPSAQPLRPIRLDFLGGEDLKEPNRLVGADQKPLDLLIDSLVSEKTFPVRLSRIPNDDRVINAAIKKFRTRGWLTKTMRMPYPFLELNPQRSPFRKSLGEDLRRARRRAEKCGTIALDVVNVESEKDLRSVLQEAFQIEASGWKGRNGTAILSTESRRRFFERLAEMCRIDGTLSLSFLTVGGERCAVHYAIQSGNEYWLLNIGYRDEMRECSPGNLLLEESIRDATRRGLSRYNFLGKEEAWTKRWTSDSRDCVVLAAYRPNYHGVRAIASDALYLYQKRRSERRRRGIRTASGTPFRGLPAPA